MLIGRSWSMPEIDQYSFDHQELIQALIKQAGLHEGKWQLVVTFGLAAINMGPGPTEIVPGAAVGVTGFGLQRAKPDSPSALVADAAVVNPASTLKRRPSSQSPSGAR